MGEMDRRIAGRYQLTSRLGQGAMGVVWTAHDDRLERIVAVKELLVPDNIDEAKAVKAKERAMREARIAARLQHPNAITVYDAVEDHGRPWLIMEYLPSRSLSAILAEHGPLPYGEVAAFGHQLASALAAAHRKGILHRDVKPGNVLVNDNGTVKITDFGISRATDEVTATATGTVGTPAFFSPEVASGQDAGYPSDVFSLGATLYNAVEGTPPFGYGDNNAIALLHRVAKGEIEPPAKAGPLAPLLLRLLAKDPAERPTMDEAAAALAAVDMPVAPVRRIRRLAILLVAAIVLIGVAGGLFFWRTKQNDTASPPASTPTSELSTTTSTATTTTVETPPSTPPPPALPTADKALADYYALMPGDLQTCYSRLTDRFKAQFAPSFASYQGFWGQFSSVTLSDVSPQGPATVSATITYNFKTGGSQTERHTYSMVQVNGQWAIDGQARG